VIVAAALLLVVVTVGIVRGRSGDGLATDVLRTLQDLSSAARQEWITAMLAEYDALDDPRTKRRFARGCLRAVVLRAGPSDRTAVAIRGVIDLVAAGAVGLAIFGLVHYPGLRAGWAWSIEFAGFLAIIAAYLFAAAHLSRLGSPAARRAGTLAGAPAALCGWWIAQSNGGTIGFAAMLLVVLPCAIAAMIVARPQAQAGQAAIAALCGALSAGLFVFVSYVATTYATLGPPTAQLLDEFTHSGAHDYRSWAVGDDLGGAVFLLLAVPVLATAAGLVAARLVTPRAQTFPAP